ncbi:IMPACT family protein [Aliidiomarina sp. Khilg15.8]
MGYELPAGFLARELVVKKSRFIAWAAPVNSREDALAWVEQARQVYPDAGHHCWAYVIGDPGAASSAAMNDDGEPSGTAGKPILNVLQHKAIGDVVVVVIRYFGGIKLGAGGLVRAYSGATEQVLRDLKLVQRQAVATCRVVTDFAHEQHFRHFADTHAGLVETVDYDEQVIMQLQVPEAEADNLEAQSLSVGATFKLLARGLD